MFNASRYALPGHFIEATHDVPDCLSSDRRIGDIWRHLAWKTGTGRVVPADVSYVSRYFYKYYWTGWPTRSTRSNVVADIGCRNVDEKNRECHGANVDGHAYVLGMRHWMPISVTMIVVSSSYRYLIYPQLGYHSQVPLPLIGNDYHNCINLGSIDDITDRVDKI